MQLTENILEHVQNLLIIADENGEIVYVSPSVEGLLGYLPVDLIGSGWWDIRRVSPEETLEVRRYVTKCIKGEVSLKSGSYVSKVYTRSGIPKWIIWNDSLLKGQQLLGVGMDYTQNRKETMTQKVIFNIAERAKQTEDMDSLFRYMAQEIMGIFDTKNIYILLYDETNENVSFPIYIDEEFPEGRKFEGSKIKIKGGLTDYTLRAKVPKLLSRKDMQELMERGELNPIGDLALVWMGLPLMFGEKIFGLIALQDYKVEEFFDEKDLELMNFISREISSILERKQAEKELKESEKQYRDLTETLFEGICIHNTETILVANQAFCQMFGYEQEELRGLKLKNLATPGFLQMVVKSISEKSDLSFEVVAQNRYGEEFWVEVLSKDHTWKGEKVRLSALRNIDSKKLAEEAEESVRRDAKIKAMIQNSSEIIALLDLDAILTFESSSVKRILGFGTDERKGHDFYDIIHRDDQEKFRKAFKNALKNPETSYKVEFRMKNSKGKFRDFQAVLKNLLSDALVGGILVSSRDITELKKAQRKISESEERTRTMVQHSQEAIVLLDLEKHLFTEVNPKAEKLFGYNRKELLTMGPLDLSPRTQENGEDSHKLVEEYLTQVIEKGSLTYEWIHINQAGDSMDCEIRLVLLPGSTERVARGSILDISDRKREEKERLRIDQEARAQKEVLLKISQSKALIAGDLDQSLSEIIVGSGKTLDVSRVSVWFFNENRTQMVCKKSFQTNGASPLEGKLVSTPLDNPYFNALEKERIIYSGNGAGKYLKDKLKTMSFLGEFAVMDLPIRVGGKVVGIVSFEDKNLEKTWSQEEQNFAASMADLAALSIEAWERAKAERNLLESEERFKALFERSPDAIFVENELGIVLDLNEAAAKLHDSTREEIIGKNVVDLVPDQYKAGVKESLPKWFSGEIDYTEGVSAARNGSIIPVEIHAGRVVYKGKPAIILQVRDITRRKEQEAKLLASKEQLSRQNKTLLELARSRPRKSGDINLAMEEITRAASDTTGSDRVSIWFFEENRKEIECRCEYDRKTNDFTSGAIIKEVDHPGYFQALATERFVMAHDSREKELTRAFFMGKYTGKATALVHAPIRSSGDVLGMVSFEMDDEVREWTTEELTFAGSMADLVALSLEEWKKKRAEEELLQRNFELDNFVYRASHDLKAPLNSLMGLIGLIQSEDPSETIKEYIALMNRSISKLEAFILDLADYSRNARLDLTSKSINFEEMLRESIEELSFMENANRTEISIEINQPEEFHSDPMRISIVLNNFISNAIKYQDLKKEKGRVHIKVSADGNIAVITIKDNGVGIPKEHQDKIFDMFFRASVQSHGTGLGLYIVKDAISKLKGHLDLESEPGLGSTFTITLPNVYPSN